MTSSFRADLRNSDGRRKRLSTSYSKRELRRQRPQDSLRFCYGYVQRPGERQTAQYRRRQGYRTVGPLSFPCMRVLRSKTKRDSLIAREPMDSITECSNLERKRAMVISSLRPPRLEAFRHGASPKPPAMPALLAEQELEVYRIPTSQYQLRDHMFLIYWLLHCQVEKSASERPRSTVCDHTCAVHTMS